MNAQVIYEGFTHVSNRLEAAWQDYELANLEYEMASERVDSLNPRSVAAFHRAIDRRNLCWERYWAAKKEQ